MSDSLPSIKFIYNYCRDLEAMRAFYIDQLGLPLTSFRNDDKAAYLEHNCGGIEFMWFLSTSVQMEDEFSRQPGWPGGALDRVSCSIEYTEEGFFAAVERLKQAGAKSSKPNAEDRGSYWAFPVLDPMGNTVELFFQVKG
jgi:catechol 2,3-dioxygenase-like lactoylglutathione lyase family enzyme